MTIERLQSILQAPRQAPQQQGGMSAITSLLNATKMQPGQQSQEDPEAQLFDASEFFSPEALRAALDEMQSYQPPRQQP